MCLILSTDYSFLAFLLTYLWSFFYIYSRFEPFLLLLFAKTLQMDNLQCILLPVFLLLLLTLFHQYYFSYVYIFYNKRIVAFM